MIRLFTLIAMMGLFRGSGDLIGIGLMGAMLAALARLIAGPSRFPWY